MTIDIPPVPPGIQAAAPIIPAASPASADAPAPPKVVGQASMLPDGTISMEIRVEDPASGAVGHAYPQFAPGSPRYQEILDKLGPFKPGEYKPVMSDWQ